MLVAHRGFRSDKGENRMCDFQNALQICKAVEFDIRLTKDKKIIIFHDYHLRRIGKTNITLRHITYDQLRVLPFFRQNPQFLPPLFIEDFTKKLANNYQMINVEIKPDRYSDEELALLAAALCQLRKHSTAEIIVSSFSHQVLEWITTLDPNDFKKGYLFEKPKEIDWKLITQFDYVHPYVGTVKQKRNVSLFHKINLPMNIWTFKNNDDVIKVQKLYQDDMIYSYISDKSDLKI